MIKSRQLVELGDIFKIASGGTPNRKNSSFFEKGKIPWFKTGDLKNRELFQSEEKITREALTNSSAKLFPVNTVLVAMYGATIGACGILRIEGATNQACAAFLPNETILSEYLYYFIQYNKRNFVNLGVGGAQPNISCEKLKNFKIFLPSISSQERVVKIINKAESALEKRRDTIRLCDEFLKSVFLQMFGDPFVNPKKFQSKKIEELCNVETGSTPSRKNFDFYNGNIPWIKTAEVNNCKIIKTEETISKEALTKSNCKVFPIETVLIAMYGQGKTRGKVGITGLEASTNQACAAILPSDKIVPLFLFWQLHLRYLELRGLGRGGNQPNLNLNIVKNLKVIIPDIKEQQKFADIVQKVERLKEKFKQSEAELETLFNSLMQRAFKGELFKEK